MYTRQSASVARRMQLVNGIRHLCYDGCMFPDKDMREQQTWNDIIDLEVEVIAKLIACGLPADEAPNKHCAVWQRHVGRGETSALGKVISLDEMLDMIIAARGKGGEKFQGIDLLEGADVAFDMPEEEFQQLVAKLKANGLLVGDVGACHWPDPNQPDQGGMFGSDEDRKRGVEAVRRACILWHRFQKAGVALYGCIRVDSGSGPAAFNQTPETNRARLVVTFQEMSDVAGPFGLIVVVEGEICWGGQAGYNQCLEIIEAVGRKNFLFQADLAHLTLFMAAFNVAPADSLFPAPNIVPYNPQDPELDPQLVVPVGAVQATPDQFMAGWDVLGEKLGPKTASFHVAQSRGLAFGAGSHDKTGRHQKAKDPNGVVNVVEVAPLFLLVAA